MTRAEALDTQERYHTMDDTGIAVGLRIAASDARIKAGVLDGEAAAALLDIAAKFEAAADRYENEVPA